MMRTGTTLGAWVLALSLVAAATAVARPSFSNKEPLNEPPVPEAMKRAGFTQNLDAQVPLDLTFRNDLGETVTLGSLVDGKPTIINLVYYECPMLCTEVLNSLLDSVKGVGFTPGQEYSIITVSFDPTEGPELAAAKKKNVLTSFGRPGAEKGWHFLVADAPTIETLTKTVGFSYSYDEKVGEFGHASGIVVITPEGRISHYFFGLSYPSKDVRLALVDASEGKIGSPIDQLLLLCYHYNPAMGKYTVAVMSLLRGGAAVMVLVVAWFVVTAIRNRSPQGGSTPRHAEAAP